MDDLSKTKIISKRLTRQTTKYFAWLLFVVGEKQESKKANPHPFFGSEPKVHETKAKQQIKQ